MHSVDTLHMCDVILIELLLLANVFNLLLAVAT